MNTGTTRTLFLPILAVIAGIALLPKTIPSQWAIDSPQRAKIVIEQVHAQSVEAMLSSNTIHLVKLWQNETARMILRPGAVLNKTAIYATTKHERYSGRARILCYHAEIKNFI